MNDKIISIVMLCCDLLEIETPEIMVVGKSFFRTKTTKAAVDKDFKKIFIRSTRITKDLVFHITHEIRHIWQSKNLYDFETIDIKNSDEVDIESYNLQPHEIDANAFALVFCSTFFNEVPTFEGMPKKVIEEIKKRAKEILKQLEE